MTRRYFYPALVALLALAVAAGSWWTGDELRRAPPLTLNLLDGSSLELDSLRGRPVLVHFWATSCTPCRRELPQLKALYKEFSGQGFEILAVAMPYDPPAQVYEFIRRHQVPWPVVLDLQGEVVRAFGDVQLVPTTFLVNADGAVVHQQLGEIETDAMRALLRRLLKQGVAA
ncbi:MAG: TlpA family protein disulfide reductase [Gammaproteobacteria bacterium]|nr:TlpA family protein disulfide reductase [Gammaproteobacteria bacterium]